MATHPGPGVDRSCGESAQRGRQPAHVRGAHRVLLRLQPAALLEPGALPCGGAGAGDGRGRRRAALQGAGGGGAGRGASERRLLHRGAADGTGHCRQRRVQRHRAQRGRGRERQQGESRRNE